MNTVLSFAQCRVPISLRIWTTQIVTLVFRLFLSQIINNDMYNRREYIFLGSRMYTRHCSDLNTQVLLCVTRDDIIFYNDNLY